MKIHLCCGDVYLKDYINCDINGYLIIPSNLEHAVNIKYLDGCFLFDKIRDAEISLKNGNPNETTLDNYFKNPFIKDAVERQKQRKPIIIDKIADLTVALPFESNSSDEIVMISAWEHFWPQVITDKIIPEICRVLKSGGKFIVDFPDVIKTVEEYRDREEEMMVLLYCNHKNEYSIHHYGYTEATFKKLWPAEYEVNRIDIVKHDYPMIGMEVIKK